MIAECHKPVLSILYQQVTVLTIYLTGSTDIYQVNSLKLESRRGQTKKDIFTDLRERKEVSKRQRTGE